MRSNWSTLKHKILIFMQNRQGLTSVYAYSDGLNGKPNAWGLSGYCLRKEPQEEFQTTWTISFFLYNWASLCILRGVQPWSSWPPWPWSAYLPWRSLAGIVRDDSARSIECPVPLWNVKSTTLFMKLKEKNTCISFRL